MADMAGRSSKTPTPASQKTKVARSHKPAPTSSPVEGNFYREEDEDEDSEEEGEEEEDDDEEEGEGDEDAAVQQRPPIPRNHTPGHISSRSKERRRMPSELSIRQRSQSMTKTSHAHAASRAAAASNAPTSKPPPSIPPSSSNADLRGAESTPENRDREPPRRPTGLRSTSAIAGGSNSNNSSKPHLTSSVSRHFGNSARGPSSAAPTQPRGQHTSFPPLPDPKTAPDVPPAPASGMYWSRAPVSGAPHTSLRAHTTTLIGSNIFVFGGCDSRACFNELYVFDADAFYWSRPHVAGDIPVPLRAMTCTAVGKKLVVFGGGDGPAYYNDVYVLDTTNFRWSKPRILGDQAPSKRRAHTACLYKNGIYVFGGGDGVRALNDIWRLDVSDVNKMSWRLVSAPDKDSKERERERERDKGPTTPGGTPSKEARPRARGYHTANMVGSKLIIYGGSDGGECFNDVWVYDVDAQKWKAVSIPVTHRRLSHTSTIVGSYLFVIGGHDGNEYSNEVLLLNLVTMTWDRRKVYGLPPSGRGYHGTVLYDSRLYVIGGFDGSEVFGDVWILELAVHAYYSQISHFSIEV